MHIVLDLQACQSPESGRRGIGRYSLALAKAMATCPRGHRITVALNSAMEDSVETIRAQFDALLSPQQVIVWQGLSPTSFVDRKNTFRRHASEILRVDALRSLKPDVVHVASLFEGIADNVIGTIPKQQPYLTAATLYDLIPLAHMDIYLSDAGVNEWYMEKIGHLCRADQLLGISQFSCDEARELLAIPKERLTDISGAADDIFTRLESPESFRAELMVRYGVRKNFVMYAGGFDARKNIGALIRAFAKLPEPTRRQHQLVIVGGAPVPERAALDRVVASVGLSPEDVVFTGYVPDADLAKLYNLCSLYAFPSLQEGFGLPALEAMSSGAVVIGSATSSLPEVIGFEDALFDPRDEDALSAKMQVALTDLGFRGRFLEHALEQCRKFSWAESARRALEGMEIAFERDVASRLASRTSIAVRTKRRTALLPAPGSSLPGQMRDAKVFADEDCHAVRSEYPLSALASLRSRFDRVVVEISDDAYCAKTIEAVGDEPADIVLTSSTIGRALATLALLNRDRLVEIVYRAGGYKALRQALQAGLDAGTLARLVPARTLDLLGQSQIVSPDEVEEEIRVPWRDHADAVISAMLDTPAAASAEEWDWASVSASIAANAALGSSTRRWFVDISILAMHDAGTGIQRVVRHVLDELISSPPPGIRIEPVTLGDDGVFRHARSYCQKRYFPEEQLPDDEIVDFHAGDTYLGLDLGAHLVPAHVGRFKTLRARGVRQYFVVYDLLPLLRPDCFNPTLLPLFRSWYEAIAEISDGVLCISRAVADEFEGWLHQARPDRLRPLEIGWFHLGADLAGTGVVGTAEHTDDAGLSGLGDRPTFLMVGTIEPRKGHAQALSAFERLWAQDREVNLLIVGRPGWLVEDLVDRLRQHPMRGRRLFWFENADDNLLLAAYGRASALLMASEGEGFGLPLIEAAHHGVPLIVRDLPVFREIAGEHAHYFHGYAAEDLAVALESWLYLDDRGVAPRSTGMQWKTWPEAVAQLADVLLEGRWTHWWVPGRVRRFGAYDYRFQTQGGRLSRGRMEATGQTGMLMYGPYVPMAAGHYSMEIFGQGGGKGWIDVCSTKGTQVHAVQEFDLVPAAGGGDRTLARMDFTLIQDVVDLELRVAVHAGADLGISSIKIRMCQPDDRHEVVDVDE